MQAGFAFLEAGLTRMKNVGHVAPKERARVLGIAAIVYYLVGFGLAFGDDGSGFVKRFGFLPTADELLAVGQAPFMVERRHHPQRAGAALLSDRVAAVSLAIVWGAMAERTRLSVAVVLGITSYTLIFSIVALGLEQRRLALRQGRASSGSTVVHYQGALAGLAGALLGPRIRQVGSASRRRSRPQHGLRHVGISSYEFSSSNLSPS